MTPGQTIAELEGLLEGTSITALSLTTSVEAITVRRQPGSAPPVRPAGRSTVTAPCCGEFLHRHPLQPAPLVQIGQPVRAGAVLGLLRIGPLLLQVVAPRDGAIEAIADDGGLVGYGTPLVHIVTKDDA
ncbi:MAG: acetyl-CoA carboxylase biotin carboxyl carrier protein subunit [Alphaproteobacteria bacterium]|nr:MAG: acetyl-CoA carboxylase biotin carboxyl carrier protein subunit [Alphaproteobacteria bacterium]